MVFGWEGRIDGGSLRKVLGVKLEERDIFEVGLTGFIGCVICGS